MDAFTDILPKVCNAFNHNNPKLNKLKCWFCCILMDPILYSPARDTLHEIEFPIGIPMVVYSVTAWCQKTATERLWLTHKFYLKKQKKKSPVSSHLDIVS